MSKKKNKVVKKSVDVGEDRKIKSLVIDIETTYATLGGWGLLDQNFALNQVLKSGNILCFAAKWVGDDFTWFSSVAMTDRKSMLQEIWNLLNRYGPLSKAIPAITITGSFTEI